jgi:hypothetical protein
MNPSTLDEVAEFEPATGREYLVVVDGWTGTHSGFTLEVTCVDVEAATVGGSGGPPAEPGPGPVGGEDPPQVGPAPLSPAGCGCGGGWGPQGLGAVGVAAAVVSRRRRAR